eukprot:COSAG01_NODE_5483_length_4230_cov_17.465505_8_plen_154_part_00
MQKLRQKNYLKNGAKVFLVGTQMDLPADKLSTTSDAKAAQIAHKIGAVQYVLAGVAAASALLPVPLPHAQEINHSLRVMSPPRYIKTSSFLGGEEGGIPTLFDAVVRAGMYIDEVEPELEPNPEPEPEPEEGEEVLPPPDPSAEHMFCLESEC